MILDPSKRIDKSKRATPCSEIEPIQRSEFMPINIINVMAEKDLDPIKKTIAEVSYMEPVKIPFPSRNILHNMAEGHMLGYFILLKTNAVVQSGRISKCRGLGTITEICNRLDDMNIRGAQIWALYEATSLISRYIWQGLVVINDRNVQTAIEDIIISEMLCGIQVKDERILNTVNIFCEAGYKTPENELFKSFSCPYKAVKSRAIGRFPRF